jgi:hypothetical protein
MATVSSAEVPTVQPYSSRTASQAASVPSAIAKAITAVRRACEAAMKYRATIGARNWAIGISAAPSAVVEKPDASRSQVRAASGFRDSRRLPYRVRAADSARLSSPSQRYSWAAGHSSGSISPGRRTRARRVNSSPAHHASATQAPGGTRLCRGGGGSVAGMPRS